MSTRTIGGLLLACGAGLCAGYAAACSLGLLDDLRGAPTPIDRDPVRYARTRRRIDLIETLRSSALMTLLTYGPFGTRLDRALASLPVWLRPSAFSATLTSAIALADLPVAFVHDHALERRFGLTEQSTRAWFVEYAKGAALGGALTTLLAGLMGVAVRRAPRAWPLYASLATLPLLVLANLIVPTYVLPLFNRFEPLAEGALNERLRALATRLGVADAEILRMDMSRQTRKANAFVTGVLGTHRIVLGDTLIEAFTPAEIEFVVAHELGHYLNGDTWRAIAAAQLLATLLFVIAARLTDADRSNDRPRFVSELFARMLVASHALRPLLLAYSRSREWAADRFARAITQDPATGAAALRRLRDLNLADEDPPRWHELLFASHPSLRARIDALESAPASPP